MTKDEQLKYCKLCNNRKFDPQTGFLCSLTNAKADFDIACESFSADAQAIHSERRMQDYLNEEDNDVNPMRERVNGTHWLLWIGGLSILNSLLRLIGIGFVFGLGITSITDALSYALTDSIALGVFVSIMISSLFIGAYYLANTGHKWAFTTAYVLYALDTLIFVIGGFVEPVLWIYVGVHAIPLYAMATKYDWKN